MLVSSQRYLQLFFVVGLFAVIVMATDGPVIRQLMLDAYDLGYINGEFVFFNIYPFTDDLQFRDFTWRAVSKVKAQSHAGVLELIFNGGGGGVGWWEAENNMYGIPMAYALSFRIFST